MSSVVPDAWKPQLRRYLRERSGQERDRLSASDFSSRRSISIRFPDGSYALFRHSFTIRDEATGDVIVFTEHCGYHAFPLGDAEVEELWSSNSGADQCCDPAAG